MSNEIESSAQTTQGIIEAFTENRLIEARREMDEIIERWTPTPDREKPPLPQAMNDALRYLFDLDMFEDEDGPYHAYAAYEAVKAKNWQGLIMELWGVQYMAGLEMLHQVPGAGTRALALAELLETLREIQTDERI
jgi:hypothetical protein